MNTPTTAAEVQKMDLRKFVNATPKTIWVEYRNTGIVFELNFMSKARFKVLTEKCSTIKYDADSKTHRPQIDTKKIAAAFVREAVTGWRGVSPKSLGHVLPVNLENLTEEQKNQQIDFDVEQLVFLVENAFELDTFLQEATMNPQLFNQNTLSKEDQEKNSSSSPAGS